MDTSEQYRKMIEKKAHSPMEDVEIVKWYEDPVYIKMCEKAEEIQAIWKKKFDADYPSEFDYYFKMGRICCAGVSYHNPDLDPQPEDTWLPRQDQLQEMMGLSDRQLMKQFRDFLWWITGEPQLKYPGGVYDELSMPYGIFLPSFEQLWLAFVMKEKYGKIWNGKEWVK